MHQRIHNLQQYEKTPAEMQELASRLIKGDKDAIIPVIEGHIELAYKIAGKFSKRIVHQSQDKVDSIIAQAFFGLTRAVNDAATGALYDTNITPYIAKSIAGYIRDFLAKDHLIPIEKDAFKKLAVNGQLFQFLPVTVLLQEDIDGEYDEEESFRQEMFNKQINLMLEQPDMSVEMIDKISQLEWSAEDSEIISKILEGYTYYEIGQQLGKNERFVKYHIHCMQERVKKIYEDIGNVS